MKNSRDEANEFIISKKQWEDELPPETTWSSRLLTSLWKQKPALFGVFILFSVLLLAIFAPIISPFDPDEQLFKRAMKPPMTFFDGKILGRLIIF